MRKKALLLSVFLFLSVLFVHAQITGEFVLGDDDEIYFECYNGSGYNLPSSTVVLVDKFGRQLTLDSSGWWNHGTKIWIGPNFNWSWQKGEQIHLYVGTYNMYGYLVNTYIGYWICPVDKPSKRDKKDQWNNKPRVRIKGLGKGWGNKVLKFLRKVR